MMRKTKARRIDSHNIGVDVALICSLLASIVITENEWMSMRPATKQSLYFIS